MPYIKKEDFMKPLSEDLRSKQTWIKKNKEALKNYDPTDLINRLNAASNDHLGGNISDITKNLKNIVDAIKKARKNIKKSKKSEEEQLSMDEISYILDDIDNFIEGMLPAVENAENMANNIKDEVKEETQQEVIDNNINRNDTVDKIRKILEEQNAKDKQND
jgi:ABC-type transporter Mla subunit MlaD